MYSYSTHEQLGLAFLFFSIFPPQLKSLFEILTSVSERNTEYQYLILASLILVACIRIVLVVLIQ
jgi:ABC-type microcin C transport system permease subunit YejE